MNRQTDTSENIIFQQLIWQATEKEMWRDTERKQCDRGHTKGDRERMREREKEKKKRME